jgi:hypothetical protein
MQTKYPEIKLRMEEMDEATLRGAPSWIEKIAREDHCEINKYFVKLWRGMKGIWNWSRKELFEVKPQKKDKKHKPEKEQKTDAVTIKRKIKGNQALETNWQPAAKRRKQTQQSKRKQSPQTGTDASPKLQSKKRKQYNPKQKDAIIEVKKPKTRRTDTKLRRQPRTRNKTGENLYKKFYPKKIIYISEETDSHEKKYPKRKINTAETPDKKKDHRHG